MQYLDLNGGCINNDGAERVAVRFGCALGFRAVCQLLARRARGGSVDAFLRGGMDVSSLLGGCFPARRDGWIPARSERAQSGAAPSGAAGSCRIDTPGRMLCLFAQQSCLMLLAYQGDQHGSDNTCLTPPAFSHRRVDLLSRLLFSGRQFLALSVNGVNNSHQYLI